MALWPVKDPDEIVRHSVDWTSRLNGDTISTSTVTVAGVTLDSSSKTATAVTVVLSGGTSGTIATITSRIVTVSSGQTFEEVVTLPIHSAREPLSLEDAKAHLRVTHADEDRLIEGLIRGARQTIETLTGLKLRRQSNPEYFDFFSSDLRLQSWPIASVDAITYLDANEARQTVEPDRYAMNLNKRPARIRLALGKSWPSAADPADIIVTATAGYAQGAVPDDLIAAIQLIVAGRYHDRENADIPAGVYPLIANYRIPV